MFILIMIEYKKMNEAYIHLFVRMKRNVEDSLEKYHDKFCEALGIKSTVLDRKKPSKKGK
jgi:hypothetical protein